MTDAVSRVTRERNRRAGRTVFLPANGLGNMNRRLKEIGGHCDIETAPGQGTKVIFSLLLKPD